MVFQILLYVVVCCCICLTIIFAYLIYLAGEFNGENKIEKEAVKRGYAKFELDEKTNVGIFKWKE